MRATEEAAIHPGTRKDLKDVLKACDFCAPKKTCTELADT